MWIVCHVKTSPSCLFIVVWKTCQICYFRRVVQRLQFRYSCTSNVLTSRAWCNHWWNVCYTLLWFLSCQVVSWLALLCVKIIISLNLMSTNALIVWYSLNFLNKKLFRRFNFSSLKYYWFCFVFLLILLLACRYGTMRDNVISLKVGWFSLT